MNILSLLAAAPATAVPSEGEQLMSSIMMFGLIFVVFYFILIRPQQQKFKKHEAMIANIARGDKVVTAGGIIGKVTKVEKEQNTLSIEIADNVEIKVIAATIANVLESVAKPINDNSKK